MPFVFGKQSQKQAQEAVEPSASHSGGTMGTITAEGLNVRQGPSSSTTILGSLPRGSEIAIVGESGAWLQVEYFGQTAFVFGKYVDQKQTNACSAPIMSGAVTATALNVRSSPRNGDVVGVLYKNDDVAICAEVGGWYQINYNGVPAYVSASYVQSMTLGPVIEPTKQVGPEQKPVVSAAEAKSQGIVTAQALNVRAAPRNGQVIGAVYKGGTVDIVAEKDGWYEIVYEGKQAFVSAAYVYQSGGAGGTKAPQQTSSGAHRPSGGEMQDVYDTHAGRLQGIQMNHTNDAEFTAFSKHWTKNKARYEKVAAKVNMPADLIAALHWRESSGRFDRYMHQGDPLGKPAVNWPNNIPIFYNWEDSAIHALGQKSGLQRDLKITKETTDMAAQLTYAEYYNGLGYHRYHKDVATPYVYAGTNQYTSGKYVADGKFSQTAKDRQAGVYGMLNLAN